MSRVTTAIPAFAIGVAAAALSAGCSAGQHAQTAIQVAAVPGANRTIEMTDGDRVVGRIALRDLTIPYKQKGYAAGASAPLAVRVFNDSPNPVKLCDATSEAGDIGKAIGSASAGPSASAAPPASPAAASATPSASASASPSAAQTASPSPSAAAPPAKSGTCPLDIRVPAQGYVLLLPGQAQYLQIQKLQEELEAGTHTIVLFQFEDAKGKQWRTEPFEVPMSPPGTPLPRASSDIEENAHS